MTAPFPPGDYPLIVIGTGPGGLQMSYALRRLGVRHAVLSADDTPGGMFCTLPVFQRLNTSSRSHALVERDADEYYRYDWNSLWSATPQTRAHLAEFMDGSSYFPLRAEMHAALVAFAERNMLEARYGCRWETSAHDGTRFLLGTSDGAYRASVVVLAVGMTEPWVPGVPGLDEVPHYVELTAAARAGFAGKRVFIVGKRNSAFELAEALLPITRQLILGSPRPVRPSVFTSIPSPPRARDLAPFEDHLFGGGTRVLDASIERIARQPDGYRVATSEGTFEVDEVICATGFATPLRDLPALGVATFYDDRLPVQTPYWESTTVPGVYFAGSVTQGQAGLRKYKFPARSASVVGFRWNALVGAAHIAEKHFGIARPRTPLRRHDVTSFLLRQATTSPALWGQQSHLARVVTFGDDVIDAGTVPLVAFLDDAGPDALAITVETDPGGNLQPAVYVRSRGRVHEHVLGPAPRHDFTGPDHQRQLAALLP